MKKSLLLFGIIFGSLLTFSSCETDEEMGEKAARDYCECLKKKSVSECDKQIDKEYKAHLSDDFIDAFNKISYETCGVTGQIIRSKYISTQDE